MRVPKLLAAISCASSVTSLTSSPPVRSNVILQNLQLESAELQMWLLLLGLYMSSTACVETCAAVS